MRRHWKELALYQNRIELEPDFDFYLSAELKGNFVLITARCDKLLVGYIGQLVARHPHYVSTIWARNDLFWLDPAYREGMTGVKLFIKMEELLRTLGVTINGYTPKDHFERERGGVGKILTRLGYEPVGTEYQKYIGD